MTFLFCSPRCPQSLARSPCTEVGAQYTFIDWLTGPIFMLTPNLTYECMYLDKNEIAEGIATPAEMYFEFENKYKGALNIVSACV